MKGTCLSVIHSSKFDISSLVDAVNFLLFDNFVTHRYHCIIITVKYTHICRHLSQWRRAASELQILAGLHVQMNRKRGTIADVYLLTNKFSTYIFARA
jgi:hypothetical protein